MVVTIEISINENPAASPYQSPKNNALINNSDIDNPFTDGIGDMKPEEKKGNEVKKSSPEDGPAGRKHAGGNNGGDRVG